ncbi:hypothetical protein FIU87_01310 [Bacillus sp. THAF10]|uniref:hypothetical protein n=1 Tax=Bacillus sp. THAF10 TaxID=2587848 RepID=UPI0012680196|nr:hypothetical protein [Bacillus sp. THAF10]QFT87290.1 hypothetical protein FIU87_01310 [Bacillus sp. THAF10]
MKNNPEWLEPLKHRPDLFMDESESERLERVLRGEEKSRKPLLLPSILVSVTIATLLLFFVSSLIPEKPGLSAELQDSLSAFEEIGEPVYHLTELPFEYKKVISTPLQFSFSRVVDVRYIGEESEGELLALMVYFDMPNGVVQDAPTYTNTTLTIKGEEIEYTVKNARPDLQIITWKEGGISFQIMNSYQQLEDIEIEQLIHSIKKYE